MSNTGQSNFRGVNYQAWSALLLFLLRANDSSFESITLEDAEWEDFTLKYSSGKKIICESKYRAEKIKPSLVKDILAAIASREGEIVEADEILIICPEVDENLESNIRYYKWDKERIGKWFKEKGFSEDAIKLVSHLSFFKAPSAEYLYNEALSYFYNLNAIGYIWLPQSEVDAWLKKTLVDEVYAKSENGAAFTREKLHNIIDSYFREKIQNNPVYDAEQSEVKERYAALLKDLTERNVKAIQRDLSVLSAQPQLMYIAIETIFKTPENRLKDWDVLWSHLIDRQYWFRIVHEFKSRIHHFDDADYVLDLFCRHVDAFTNPAFDDYRSEYSVQLVVEILDKYHSLASKALTFTQDFLKRKKFRYQDLEESEAKQEKVEISSLLEKLFDIFNEENDSVRITEIIGLLSMNFSLIEDEGQYYIYTPAPVFAVFKKYLCNDLSSRLVEVIKLIVDQYNSHEYFRGKYNGWDATGSGLSQSGSEFSIADKHYIEAILTPALLEQYESDKPGVWKLVEDRFITSDDSKVSALRPDFLNRAAVPLLLNEYKSGSHSEAAMDYLTSLMLMKGVPSKFELIFQKVRDDVGLTDDQKWLLVKPFLEYYKLPITVFVEQVVSDLAIRGYPDAIKAIKDWVKNPDYREQQQRHSFFIAQSMFKLLATVTATESHKAGIEIFKEYIASEDFTIKLDSFDSYDISRALARIIETDYDEGLSILKGINAELNLTRNQQTLIWLSIEQLDKSNAELLKNIYYDFVKATLIDELGSDTKRIEAKYTETNARELAVQFAEHLAEQKLMDEGMVLVSIFMDDNDPLLINGEDDPDGTFNYHERVKAGEDVHTLNTVRGWTAWSLRYYCGMSYQHKLESTIDKVWVFTSDPNLYVRAMSTFPMTELMKNRHTILPETGDRFMSLELADKIETLALNFLEDNNNSVLLQHMVHVMQHFHTLNTAQALLLFEKYGLSNLRPVSEDIVHLLPYFALWRKKDFTDKKCKVRFGNERYKTINTFDDVPFVELLKKCIDEGDDDLRTQIAWYFWTLPKKNQSDYEELFRVSYKYLNRLANRYTQHALNRIGYFLSENLEKKPKECLVLWEKVIRTERDWLAQQESLDGRQWWAHHQNDEFLEATLNSFGAEKYIELLAVLLSYPDKYSPMINPEAAYDHLKNVGSELTSSISEKLCEKYPSLLMK